MPKVMSTPAPESAAAVIRLHRADSDEALVASLRGGEAGAGARPLRGVRRLRAQGAHARPRARPGARRPHAGRLRRRARVAAQARERARRYAGLARANRGLPGAPLPSAPQAVANPALLRSGGNARGARARSTTSRRARPCGRRTAASRRSAPTSRSRSRCGSSRAWTSPRWPRPAGVSLATDQAAHRPGRGARSRARAATSPRSRSGWEGRR